MRHCAHFHQLSFTQSWLSVLTTEPSLIFLQQHFTCTIMLNQVDHKSRFKNFQKCGPDFVFKLPSCGLIRLSTARSCLSLHLSFILSLFPPDCHPLCASKVSSLLQPFSWDTSPPIIIRSLRLRVLRGGQCNPGMRNLKPNPPQSLRLNTKKMSEQMLRWRERVYMAFYTVDVEESEFSVPFLVLQLICCLCFSVFLAGRVRVWMEQSEGRAGVDGWVKAMSLLKQKRKRVPRGEQLRDLHRHSTMLSSLNPFSPLPWLWKEAQKPLPGETLCLTSLSSFDEEAVGVVKTPRGYTDSPGHIV